MFDPSKLASSSSASSSSSSSTRREIDRIKNLLDKILTLRISQYFPSFRSYEVVLAEIACSEPDCVPLETLLAIVLLDSPDNQNIQPRKFSTKILKPLAHVQEVDLLAIAFPFQDLSMEAERLECIRLTNELQAVIHGAGSLDNLKTLKVSLDRCIKDLAVTIAIKTSEANATVVKNIPSVSSVGGEGRPSPPAAAPPTSVATPPLPVAPAVVVVGDIPKAPVMSAMDNISKLKFPKKEDVVATTRHEKGSGRRRGCPCCDPDNLDNLVDKMLFGGNSGI
eukprot:gene8418-9278_t